MFQNRINGFAPNMGIPPLNPSMIAAVRDERSVRAPLAVQTMDIYQAAMNRAIEEHELDKLFNPDFYDYQI
jgi:hypothetical protein